MGKKKVALLGLFCIHLRKDPSDSGEHKSASKLSRPEEQWHGIVLL